MHDAVSLRPGDAGRRARASRSSRPLRCRPGYTTPSPIVNTATVSSAATDLEPGQQHRDDQHAGCSAQGRPLDLEGPATAAQPGRQPGLRHRRHESRAERCPERDGRGSDAGGLDVRQQCRRLHDGVPLLPGADSRRSEPRDSRRTFLIPSSYTGPDPIVNTATVSSTATDPDLTNNSATATTGGRPAVHDQCGDHEGGTRPA